MTASGYQPIIAIIVGLLLIWLAFKVVRGMIRLAVTLAIVAVIAYFVLGALR